MIATWNKLISFIATMAERRLLPPEPNADRISDEKKQELDELIAGLFCMGDDYVLNAEEFFKLATLAMDEFYYLITRLDDLGVALWRDDKYPIVPGVVGVMFWPVSENGCLLENIRSLGDILILRKKPEGGNISEIES